MARDNIDQPAKSIGGIIEDVVAENVDQVAAWTQSNDANSAILGHWTALHLAVVADKSRVCEVLLELGASPNPQVEAPRTPLMLAAEMGRRTIFALLVEAGARVGDVSEDGHTAMSLSAGSALGDIQSVIGAGGDVNKVSKYGHTPLCRAILWAPHQVDLLLRAGANPNTKTPLGSPMTLAVDRGGNRSGELLLDFAGDVNSADWRGAHLLYMAAKEGRLNICRRIIDGGVDPTGPTVKFNGKFPHEISAGEAKLFLEQFIQVRKRREELMAIAGNSAHEKTGELEEQVEDPLFM